MPLRGKTDQLAEGIIRIAVAPAGEFSYNKFLILAERPTLIHTGRVQWFEEAKALVARHIDPKDIQIITFSHFEADECGALNHWLGVAPQAEVVIGKLAQASLEDFSIRAPRVVPNNGEIDLGNRHLVLLETPHFPHNWDACLFYDSLAKVLFSSDVGAHADYERLFIDEDRIEALIQFQSKTGFMGGGKPLRQALARLRALDIEILAIHHGAALRGKSAILKFFDRLEQEFSG